MAVSPTIELSELLGAKDDFAQLVSENRHAIVTSHGKFLTLAHRIGSIGEAKDEAWKAYRAGFSACPQVPPFQVVSIDVFWDSLIDNIVDMTADRKAVIVLTEGDAPVMVLQNFRFEIKPPVRQRIKDGLSKLRHLSSHKTPPTSQGS